jgi:hypothetical protein
MGKRDTAPEQLLQRVIDDFQSSDREGHPRHQAAAQALLEEGPFTYPENYLSRFKAGSVEVFELRRTALRFLRRCAGGRADRLPGALAADGIAFIPKTDGERVIISVHGKPKDVFAQQLTSLTLSVGARNVRVCGVDDCQRLFVKTYRREFCSIRCQQRDYKRRKRAANRVREEAQARARQRRKKGDE